MENENDVLQLASCFKDIVEEKDLEIHDLKKIIISVYGFVRIIDITENYELIETLRTYISEEMDNLIVV